MQRVGHGLLTLALVAVLPATPAGAAFPGGDGRIVLSTDRDGDFEIYLMNIDGSDPVNLTQAPNSDEFLPAFSPSGDRIVFASDRGGNFDVFLMDADGSNVKALTDETSFDSEPGFCDDDTVVFASDRDGDGEIFSIRTDGTGLKQLTTNTATDAAPTCRPDGKRIAFWTNRTGDIEIFEMKRDGGQARNLTDNPATDVDPEYGPSGKDLYFSSFRDDNFEIFRLTFSAGPNTATRGQPGHTPRKVGTAIQITDTEALVGDNRFPKVSPSDRALLLDLVKLQEQGQEQVQTETTMLLDFAQSEGVAVPITDGDGSDGQASTQPRATCEVVDGLLTVRGTSGGEKIEIVIPDGFPQLIEAVVDGDVLCTFVRADVDGFVVFGGLGGDTVTLGPGVDIKGSIHTGAGPDLIRGEWSATASLAPLNLDCGIGADAVRIAGNGKTQITCGPGDDRITTGKGADSIDGGTGKDKIDSGDGEDTLRGGDGGDTIEGGSGADDLDGQAGPDKLFGGSGGDTLRGGVGLDECNGGPGRDRIFIGGDTGCEKFR